MGHTQLRAIVITLLALVAAPLRADDKSTEMTPLQVLEDCLLAAESGEYSRYVDHLTAAEQKVQAGYIVYMTSSMSASLEQGSSFDPGPETALMARAMQRHIEQHAVPVDKRTDTYREAANILAQIIGAPLPYQSPPQTHQQRSASNREQSARCANLLEDARAFLLTAFAELAQPASISGEPPAEQSVSQFFDVPRLAKQAKALKWTLYTRGEFAIAVAVTGDALPRVAGQPQNAQMRASIEFQQVDGEWKITRLLPNSMLAPVNRLALNRAGR